MSQTSAPMRSDSRSAGPGVAPSQQGDPGHPGGTTVRSHGRAVGTFLRHLAEMVGAMMIGMFVGVGIFLAIVGGDYKQSLHQYPTAALLVMAVAMAIPMVAWMRFRHHTWRNSMEMGAAMMLPAVPFLVVVWCHVRQDAPNGPYMMVSTLAMLGLMVYRRDVYSVHPVTEARTGAQ